MKTNMKTHTTTGTKVHPLPIMVGAWFAATLVRALIGPFSLIDAVVLLSPAVVVPLVCRDLPRWWWLAGTAGLAVTNVAARIAPPLATAAALVWLAACLTLPWQSARRRGATAVADGFLVFGAVLLAASRAGVTRIGPMSVAEPLVLLGCAHFTVAGFGLVSLVERARSAGEQSTARRAATNGMPWVIAGDVIVGIGHVAGRRVELAGTIALTIGVAYLGVAGWNAARAHTTARRLLRASALAPLVSMALALTYATQLATGRPHLPYDLMVATHGLVNLFVLVAGGLVGWNLVTARPIARTNPVPQARSARSLRPGRRTASCA